MRFFGLDPESIAARVNAAGAPPRIPSLATSVVVGSLGFAVVSVASFATWAWGGKWLAAHVGELGLYAACALVLIGGGGELFSHLVIGPDRRRRFYGLFALAFFLYAGVWTGSYFSLRNSSGEWLGSLLGTAILGMTFAKAFLAPRAVSRKTLILFGTHSLGYFVGSLLYETFSGLAGKLLWGAAYGLGFGAGIGYAVYACQEKVRERLAALRSRNPARLPPSQP